MQPAPSSETFMNETTGFTIRAGREEDLPRLLELIKGLALYERAPEQVTNTVEAMRRDGFGPNPVFEFALVETAGQAVGMAVWYWRYSTWRGRVLYLEDLFVEPEWRGHGLGKALFEHVMAQGRAASVPYMVFQVLDWNEPAIKFYESFGATVGGDGFVNASIAL